MSMLPVRDSTISYEVFGAGCPIVFVHGAWVSRRMWRHQVEYFREKYLVVTYDVRGHGSTEGRTDAPYSMGLFADDLNALLEALAITRPVICGISMGGMIAQTYAVRYPDRLRALILADTAVSTELTLSDWIIKNILAPRWVFQSLVRLLGTKRYADFAYWYAGITRGREWTSRDRSIEVYVKDEMTRLDVQEFNKIFGALYDFSLQDLAHIRVPTLIINGESESSAVFRHTEKMVELITGASAIVIRGAGHMPNLEKPDEFNRAIEEFIEATSVCTQESLHTGQE